jgi:hypothetical protein
MMAPYPTVTDQRLGMMPQIIDAAPAVARSTLQPTTQCTSTKSISRQLRTDASLIVNTLRTCTNMHSSNICTVQSMHHVPDMRSPTCSASSAQHPMPPTCNPNAFPLPHNSPPPSLARRTAASCSSRPLQCLPPRAVEPPLGVVPFFKHVARLAL